ncbi:hypothetical protein [Conexibacter sp. SYSU D00693]|uniref:hypothetical protein n=1 Tax=Conexibacter sp. SYSU D00693 TaxID=2812560 RepID=UPI00196A880B|nr:hypothetical protein [Conexibacter sp. SYSU D00693]
MTTGVRNVLILVALAALVAFLPGAGDTADFIGALLSVGILVALVWFLVHLYRENRSDVFGLGDRHRAMLYGALGAFAVAMAARDKLLDEGSSIGIVVFFALMGGAIYALVLVYRQWRAYGI